MFHAIRNFVFFLIIISKGQIRCLQIIMPYAGVLAQLTVLHERRNTLHISTFALTIQRGLWNFGALLSPISIHHKYGVIVGDKLEAISKT